MKTIPELELPAVDKRIKSLLNAVKIGQAALGPVEQTIRNLTAASAAYHARKRKSSGRATNR